MGAVLREQNALPYESRITYNLTAKAAIDNCRAGRAAKGAKLSLSAPLEALEFSGFQGFFVAFMRREDFPLLSRFRACSYGQRGCKYSPSYSYPSAQASPESSS